MEWPSDANIPKMTTETATVIAAHCQINQWDQLTAKDKNICVSRLNKGFPSPMNTAMKAAQALAARLVKRGSLTRANKSAPYRLSRRKCPSKEKATKKKNAYILTALCFKLSGGGGLIYSQL